MDNLKMNRQLGTKWFTFYTKVRPWFACLSTFTLIADFMQYLEVYINYWWMMVYFLATLVHTVLSVMVFVKSQGDYENFVNFVQGVLFFETISIAYNQAVEAYIQSEFNIGFALIIGVIILLLCYFIWYRLNIKYFKKRIIVMEYNYLPVDINQATVYTGEIRFCRKCGEKLIDNGRFCCKCGTAIVKE